MVSKMTLDRAARVYPAGGKLADLAALTARVTNLADYPLAASVEKNVLIYDCTELRPMLASDDARRALMAEWVDALSAGPGVVVLGSGPIDLLEAARSA